VAGDGNSLSWRSGRFRFSARHHFRGRLGIFDKHQFAADSPQRPLQRMLAKFLSLRGAEWLRRIRETALQSPS
jgi:hypothetical protein